MTCSSHKIISSRTECPFLPEQNIWIKIYQCDDKYMFFVIKEILLLDVVGLRIAQGFVKVGIWNTNIYNSELEHCNKVYK